MIFLWKLISICATCSKIKLCSNFNHDAGNLVFISDLMAREKSKITVQIIQNPQLGIADLPSSISHRAKGY